MSLEDQVREYIEKIRPYIQSHGGDVEYLRMEGMKVFLRLVGACSSCPGAVMTLRYGIESQLRELVDPHIEVERED